MMLKYIGITYYAEKIEQALYNTLKSGIRTRDLGGNYSTSEFTQAIIKEINKNKTYIELNSNGDKSEINLPNPPKPKPSEKWEIVGIDIFIEWNQVESLPEMPKKIKDLELKMISNIRN